MVNWFKKKEESYSIKIIRSGTDAKEAERVEREFLNKARSCPECGHLNRSSFINYEGNGTKYRVPMKCSECSCECEYERPYKF